MADRVFRKIENSNKIHRVTLDESTLEYIIETVVKKMEARQTQIKVDIK